MDNKISVVMATLGGDTVSKTIECLNAGTVIPDEILICMPQKEAAEYVVPLAKNVSLIITMCRGQVAQRAVGFSTAKNDYVMQIDDDIYVEKKCVEELIKTHTSNTGNIAVSPALINIETNKSIYTKPKRSLLFDKIYYWLMNGSAGYQQGRVDKSGSAIGVDRETNIDTEIETEWLAGGCIMHKKHNLITENYFPYKGKAYCEDSIHSYLLRDRGVKLMVNLDAVCYLDIFHSAEFTPREFIKNIIGDYRARLYFVKLSGRSFIRMNIFYVAWIANYIAGLIFRRNVR